MTFVNILIIFVSIINLFLGILILIKNKKDQKNIYLFLFIISIIFWSLSVIMEAIAGKIFWVQCSFFFGTLSFIIFTVFLREFLRGTYEFNKYIFYLFITFGLFFLSISFTNLMTSEMTVHQFQYYTEIIYNYGPLYNYILLYYLAILVYITIQMAKGYRNAQKFLKLQMKYFFIGMVIFAFASLLADIVMPRFGFFHSDNWGPISSIIIVLSLVYPITRYRLMDIRIIFKNFLIYVFTAIFIYITFYLFFLLQKNYFATINNFGSIIAGIIFAIIFTIALVFIQNWIKKSIQEHVYEDVYYSHEIIKGVGNELSKMIDLEKIISLTANTLKRNLNLERIAIMLKSDRFVNENEFIIVENQKFDKEKLLEFTKENILNFIQNANIIIRDELKEFNNSSHIELKIIDPLVKMMKDQQVQIILPLIESGKLLGFIFLGEKLYNNSYTKEDLEILESISEQYSIAIKNALIYKQAILVSEVLKKD